MRPIYMPGRCREKKIKPCMLTTGEMGGMQQNGGPEITTLKADDYKTWPERRKALIKLLESL